jgi:long-chain acyl-CoA synthetase
VLRNHGEQTAIVWKDIRISYDALLGHIHFYSTLFNNTDTKKVAIFSENRPEWTYTFYAAWKNKAIAVPIDFMAPAEDVAYILNDCRPEVVFC